MGNEGQNVDIRVYVNNLISHLTYIAKSHLKVLALLVVLGGMSHVRLTLVYNQCGDTQIYTTA